MVTAAPVSNGHLYRAQPTLLEHHLQQLQIGSAITPEVIAERGYWSAADWKQLDGLGFRSTQKRPECFPALVIPQHAPDGASTHAVLRWDRPRIKADGKEIKYEQPAGVGLRLDVPPRCMPGLRDQQRPLWWTEGSKKADALASRGLVVVSTPGVEGWRSPSAIPDLFGIPIKERSLICAYDSDVLSKKSVRRALQALLAWMTMKGAEVLVIDWGRLGVPHDGKLGVDDFLASSRSITELEEALVPASSWLGQQTEHNRAKSQPDGSLPLIVVANRALRETTADSLAALADANQPPQVFVRGGHLTRVRPDEAGRTIVEPFTEAALRGRLERVANYVLPDSQDGEERYKPVPPPLEVVRDVLALGHWPSVPPLVGITEAPLLRPDGSILDTPGYDPATQLLFVAPAGFRTTPVPTVPTSGDVQRALSLIWETLDDFPFSDQASQANSLALLLTPIVRPAIAGPVPLALIDKPRAGTGASLLADVVALIATGRDASMMVAPRNEDEWRKRLVSLLLGGAVVAVLDNVTDRLVSDALASALTAGEVADRVLGKSEMVHVPNRATWIATGNNVGIGGDLPRRCYLIRLDARLARPWERQGFTHDPLKPWIRERRGDLLAALLTLARSWYAAGQPRAAVRPLGSFEAWSQVLGSILACVGVPGFLTNLGSFYDRTDDEARQWEGFLAAWHRAFGQRPVLVATVLEHLAAAEDDLRSALPEDLSEVLDGERTKPSSFKKRLGKALAKRDGVLFGPYRLERAGEDGHSKSVLWCVSQDAGLRGFAGFSQPRVRQQPIDAFGDAEKEEDREDGNETNPQNPANSARVATNFEEGYL